MKDAGRDAYTMHRGFFLSSRNTLNDTIIMDIYHYMFKLIECTTPRVTYKVSYEL